MLVWLIGAATLISAASPAKPIVLDANTRADVRCVVALSREAVDANPEQVNDLAIMMYYFMGRIDGRDPKLDLGTAFAQQGTQMSHAEYVSAAATCRDQYRRRADELNAAAQAL